MDWQAQLAVVATTGYAMVLGGVIGFEREMKNRPAGFRTHMLVAGAAALLLGIGLLVLADPSVPHLKRVQIDPLRLMEAVVAGVAFIGAGTIFGSRGRDTVAGITTAASLLMVAVIGAAGGTALLLAGAGRHGAHVAGADHPQCARAPVAAQSSAVGSSA